MGKEVIIIPEGKFPLDFIAELGDQIKDSWIYLHDNCVKIISRSANDYDWTNTFWLPFEWHATQRHPERKIYLNVNPTQLSWYLVESIADPNIDYSDAPNDPEKIIFLKMEEKVSEEQ